ncbi:MAG TPA: alpha/beta fold hydrolase, partial [Acidobacteriota bacterium]|nr:alpha/beta fold hydrolase [Acidobacteriota bacterium]
MTLLSSVLSRTALRVVIDMPLVSLAIAVSAALALLAGLLRGLRRPTGVKPIRIALGAVALIGVLLVAASAMQERFLSYRASEARFSNDGIELVGTLYRPQAFGVHPAVVFIHGSGPETRKEYAFFAKLFAQNNFAALVYDKRGAGKSSGRLYESDYLDYSRDALAAVRFLKRSDGVDPECIGLIGFSEGEWVAPLAVSRSNDIAFLVVIGPSGVSPAAQVNEEIAIRLRALGYSEADVARAVALNERVFGYQRTGQATEALETDLQRASKELWFQDASDIPSRLYPPESYHWWRSVMDFAPAPVWSQVMVPVLLLKGARDQNSTAKLAKREIE